MMLPDFLYIHLLHFLIVCLFCVEHCTHSTNSDAVMKICNNFLLQHQQHHKPYLFVLFPKGSE